LDDCPRPCAGDRSNTRKRNNRGHPLADPSQASAQIHGGASRQ
jgi:hypothetical protein